VRFGHSVCEMCDCKLAPNRQTDRQTDRQTLGYLAPLAKRGRKEKKNKTGLI